MNFNVHTAIPSSILVANIINNQIGKSYNIEKTRRRKAIGKGMPVKTIGIKRLMKIEELPVF